MIRFAADENFNHTITRGLLRRQPDLDIVRAQDVGLAGAKDEVVLEWAASEGRVLLTQDARTILGACRLAMNSPICLATDWSIGSTSHPCLSKRAIEALRGPPRHDCARAPAGMRMGKPRSWARCRSASSRIGRCSSA